MDQSKVIIENKWGVGADGVSTPVFPPATGGVGLYGTGRATAGAMAAAAKRNKIKSLI